MWLKEEILETSFATSTGLYHKSIKVNVVGIAGQVKR
jgi:hypothetical protein